MMTKLRMIIGGILTGLAGTFWLIFKKRTAQRDEARKERDTARSAKESMKAANEAAERVQEASNEQIKRNNEARVKRDETPDLSRFSGPVDLVRLRGDYDE